MNAVTEAIYNELTCGSATADEFEVFRRGDTLYLDHCEQGWFKVTVEQIDEADLPIEDKETDAFGGRVLGD